MYYLNVLLYNILIYYYTILLKNRLIARNRKYYMQASRFDFFIFFKIELLKIVTFQLS